MNCGSTSVSNRSSFALCSTILLLLFFVIQLASKISRQNLILEGNTCTFKRTGNRTTEEQPNYPLQWIHPTKTGTSFANILFALACSDEVEFNMKHPSIPVDSYSVDVNNGTERATDECKARWVHGFMYPDERRKARPAWWLGEHARFETNLYPWNQFLSPSANQCHGFSPTTFLMIGIVFKNAGIRED